MNGKSWSFYTGHISLPPDVIERKENRFLSNMKRRGECRQHCRTCMDDRVKRGVNMQMSRGVSERLDLEMRRHAAALTHYFSLYIAQISFQNISRE